MDSHPLGLVALARALIDIDSTTGDEATLGRWLETYLAGLGYHVSRQPVAGARFNLLARLDGPVVVLSTHFDCVPPFFPSRLEGDTLYGRGACDAKGILAAQIIAAEQLRSAGERRVGLLFVVGEERGSDGALAANRQPVGSRFLINGEPTEGQLGRATRGALRLRLTAHGQAAHSSQLDAGESAIEKLVDALVRLRRLPLPEDPELGRTHYNAGTIQGGLAPNVIPPEATAEVMFRTVGPSRDLIAALSPLEPLVTVETVSDLPPVRLRVVPGFATAIFSFATDVPLLTAWGKPVLYGPGSITAAHTATEHVEVAALKRAIVDYERIARALLADGAPTK